MNARDPVCTNSPCHDLNYSATDRPQLIMRPRSSCDVLVAKLSLGFPVLEHLRERRPWEA
jgi:hypothetical protein